MVHQQNHYELTYLHSFEHDEVPQLVRARNVGRRSRRSLFFKNWGFGVFRNSDKKRQSPTSALESGIVLRQRSMRPKPEAECHGALLHSEVEVILLMSKKNK